MTKSKYIIFSDVHGMELPVIFSPLLQHGDIKVKGFEPVSAGFCYMFDADEKRCFTTFGQSVSLKLESRPEDARILNKEIERDI